MTLRPCKEDSVDFDNTENLYIEGDNLEVLKIIRETYLNSIDVIYIDPPYNTGNDILYVNDYSIKEDEFGSRYEVDSEGNRNYVNTETNGRFHTDWLNMMYQRVKVSRDLLKDSGFFLVAIDHNELFNLGEICDEIFGYKNRIGIISVVHKPEGRNQAKFIGPSNEFLLIYAKNEQIAKIQKVALDDEQIKMFSDSDDKGAYRLKNFIRLSDGKYATRESKPNFWYPIYVKEDLTELSLENKEGFIPVYPITNMGVERTWKTTKESFINRYNSGDIIAKKENGTIIIYEKLREDQVIKTHWIEKKYHGYHFGTKILDEILGVKTFDFPKSLYLMHDIIKLFSPKDGLVLDYFSGSATSAHAIMKLNAEDGGNRKYIMVQIPAKCAEDTDAFKAGYETICEIGKERIRRAGKMIKDEYPLKSIDVGFRVFKCDSSNMKDVFYSPGGVIRNTLEDYVDVIKDNRGSEDLLIQVMLELGIELSSKIEQKNMHGHTIYSVDGGYLVACFDDSIDDSTIVDISKEMSGCMYAIFRSGSSMTDEMLANIEQIFKTYSPQTKIRIL